MQPPTPDRAATGTLWTGVTPERLITSIRMERILKEKACVRSYTMISVLGRAVAPDLEQTVTWLIFRIVGDEKTMHELAYARIGRIVGSIRAFLAQARAGKKKIFVSYVGYGRKVGATRTGHAMMLVAGLTAQKRLWIQIFDSNGDYGLRALRAVGREFPARHTMVQWIPWLFLALGWDTVEGDPVIPPEAFDPAVGQWVRRASQLHSEGLRPWTTRFLNEFLADLRVYPNAHTLNNVTHLMDMLGVPSADPYAMPTALDVLLTATGYPSLAALRTAMVGGARGLGVCSHITDLAMLLVLASRNDPSLMTGTPWLSQIVDQRRMSAAAWVAVVALEMWIYMDGFTGAPGFGGLPKPQPGTLSGIIDAVQPRDSDAPGVNPQRLVFMLQHGAELHPDTVSGDTARFLAVDPGKPAAVRKVWWALANVRNMFRIWIEVGSVLGVPDDVENRQKMMAAPLDAAEVMLRGGAVRKAVANRGIQLLRRAGLWDTCTPGGPAAVARCLATVVGLMIRNRNLSDAWIMGLCAMVMGKEVEDRTPGQQFGLFEGPRHTLRKLVPPAGWPIFLAAPRTGARSAAEAWWTRFLDAAGNLGVWPATRLDCLMRWLVRLGEADLQEVIGSALAAEAQLASQVARIAPRARAELAKMSRRLDDASQYRAAWSAARESVSDELARGKVVTIAHLQFIQLTGMPGLGLVRTGAPLGDLLRAYYVPTLAMLVHITGLPQPGKVASKAWTPSPSDESEFFMRVPFQWAPEPPGKGSPSVVHAATDLSMAQPRGLGERDQGVLEMAASYASDAGAFWDLLASDGGPRRLLENLGSRGFARDMREGKVHTVEEGVVFAAGLRSVAPVLQLILEAMPQQVGIFAGRKKRRARSALIRYVEAIETRDLGALREQAEYVGALLGSRIASARRRREAKMERTFQYLGGVVSRLGKDGYVERSVVALRQIEAPLARAEARLLSRTEPVMGGPRIDHRDVTAGPLTTALVSSVRAVVWDRSVEDPSVAGSVLAIELTTEWSQPDDVRLRRTIHVLRFALEHLAERYAPRILNAQALMRLRGTLARWRERIEAAHGIPAELITAALGRGGGVLLHLPGETAADRIGDHLLRVRKKLGEMRSDRDTYRAVEGRRDTLRRERDGALVRIVQKRRVRGLTVFCAAYVQQ